MTAQETALLGRIDLRAHGRTPLIEIVKAELDGEFFVDHQGNYRLRWPDGYWRIAPQFVDVMKRFNKRRLERGARQITSNPQWEVMP
jgi:hypothetical protein